MAALNADTKRRLGQALGSDAAGTEVSTAINLTASVTAGTAAASKALVLGASGEIATITTATITNLNVTTTTATGVYSASKTYTAASGQATERLVRSEVTITPATTTTLGSNSLVGVRGCVTLTTGKSITGGFLYGTQGKLVLDGATVNIGSGMAYGIMGQISVTDSTITAGYVAGVGSDIYGVGSGTVAVDLFYGQHAGGGSINSMFRAYARSTYVFDLSSGAGGGGNISTNGTPGAVTGTTGWLKCLVDGAVRYIPLASSVS